MKRIYTAPNADAAWAAFEEFEEKWAKPYPAIATLWRNAWSTFIPFLDYDVEIRRVLILHERDLGVWLCTSPRPREQGRSVGPGSERY